MLKITNITTKKGNIVPVLVCDTIYTQFPVYLTFDVSVMSRISGLSVREIYVSNEDIIIE